MTARPLKYHQRGGYLALFGSPEPRDNYIGEFRPAVVEHRDPARLLHYRKVPDALLAHVAPLRWQHVNLTGDYLWGADDDVGPDGLRPLRGTTSGPRQALAA